MSGFQMSRAGNGPGGMTSFSSTLTGQTGSVPIALNQPSSQVRIANYSQSLLYISFQGPATTNSFAVAPGYTFNYDGPSITALQLNSNGQNINYGIFAV